MKSFIVALSLIASAIAQTVSILSPVEGQILTPGQNFTVQVLKPDYIQSSVEIGVAIALAHCLDNPCEDRSERLGVVLYAGGYDPTTPEYPGSASFYQNFTVTTPSITSGLAALSVVHSALIGAGPEPFIEVKNVTVVVK